MKKTKNAPTTTSDSPDTNGVSTPTLPATPTMTGKEIKAAFAAYGKANQAVQAAEEALEEVMAKRSAIVEQIANGAGKGPFSYDGTILTPVCRTSKITGKSTWFFKGPGKSDLVDVSKL